MLRTRLLLNLIPFVAILLAVGGYAIVLFSHLAHTVDMTVMDNYRSAMAAQSMNAALSRMETSLHLVMEGDKKSGAAFFADNERAFEENLSVQMKNEGVMDLTAQVRTNYDALHQAAVTILSLDQRRDQKRLFEQEVVPRIMAVNMLLEQMRKASHGNLLATSENIRKINRHVTRLMVLGMAVALLVAVYASFHLGKAILKPLQQLTRASREVGQGNLDQTIPVVSNDELGELAQAFNKMAAQLKTYRQSTTEKIIRLHRTMESALASFPDPIYVLDREGHIELKNPAAQELSQRLELNDTLPEEVATTANQVLRTGEDSLPYNFNEVLSLRVNGSEKSYLPRIHTMRDENQQTVGVAVVMHDVTRFRLLDDVKTNLVATVSHELKTPLTSVRMVLYLLLEKTVGPLNRKQSELLETARRDAERLLQILNDLLDLARLEAGDSDLNRERTPAEALVQTIMEEVRQTVTREGLKLVNLMEPGLPAVSVDRQRIGLVFHNFVTNAIKFSPTGGEIQLRATRSQNGVRFSVTDQGPGVPEEYQNRIFDRFFRVPGQVKTGAGLGLSIARQIVMAHGGRIGVRNRAEAGSEFYFTLPAIEEDLALGFGSPIKAALPDRIELVGDSSGDR